MARHFIGRFDAGEQSRSAGLAPALSRAFSALGQLAARRRANLRWIVSLAALLLTLGASGTAFGQPVILGFSPLSGPTTGGNAVTINGFGFTGVQSVTFGGINILMATVQSTSVITGTVPAGVEGPVAVVVTTSAGSNDMSTIYTYVTPPEAGPVSMTVDYSSADNAVPLELSGGTATSVQVVDAASHGLAMANGTAITYTPTTGYSGPDSFTYTASNGGGPSTTANVVIFVSPPVLAYVPIPPQSAIGSHSYSQSIAGASGGSAPHTYTKASGTLPPGLTLSGDGTLSGTPTQAGIFTFAVTAADSSTGPAAPFSVTSSDITVTVTAPTITMTPPSIRHGTVQTDYGVVTMAAAGGATPYSFLVTSGAPPPGLTLTTGGLLSGTPTTGGDFTFTVTGSDASGFFNTKTYTLHIDPIPPGAPTDISAVASDGQAVISFTPPVSSGGAHIVEYTLTASGGATWSGTSSPITATGLTNGTSYSFTVTATNMAGPGPASDVSNQVTPIAPPIAGAVIASVPYGSSDNVITLNLTGGDPTSVSAGTPLNGTATAMGTSITYTPNPGYFGRDDFTYRASNSSGDSAVATIELTVELPPAPVAAATSASVPYDTATTIDLAASITGLHASLAATSGAHGTTSVSGDVITYTPTAGSFGTDSFTYTVTGPGGTSAPATVSLTIANPAAPLAASASASMPYDTATAIDLAASITGVHSSLTATNGAHGTTSVSGDVITYTPAAGYFGADSFIYTATGPGGTSAPATVTLTVATPTAPVAAAASASVPYDTATAIDLATSITGVHSSVAATNGAHGTTSVSGDVITYAPTPGSFGVDSFTYTATGPGGTSASATVTLTVATPTAPVAAAASASVPYDTATPIDLATSITGVHSSIAATNGAHGTTSISGDVITYTPTPGSFGTDSFTYTVTGPGGTSAPATVTLTVAAPAAPLAAAASASVPYNTAKAIDLAASITGLHSSIAVTSAPTHGTTSIAGDVVTYTPTAGYSGADSFGYTATGPGGTSAPAILTLAIAAGAPDALTFSPASNTTLDPAMAGEGYSQPITVLGGSGTVIYRLTGGALPPGMVLNQTTGELTGPVGAAAPPAAYSFTVTATDSNHATGSASYTLQVLPRAVIAQNKDAIVQSGTTPLPVDLTAGATGGPFITAIISSVTPPNAGTAEVIMGDVAAIDTVYPTTFYLKFHPNPEFTGTAVVGYTLVSSFGTSNSATVSFTLATDVVVTAERIDSLVHGFVSTRQALLANGIDVPGLLQRRGMAAGNSPGTVNVAPDGNDITLNFASSLAEIKAWGEAGDAAGALAAAPADQSPFNVWIDGTATLHLKTDNGEDHWGKFGLVSVGADYLVNDKLLIGLALHADGMDDLTDTSSVSGTGLLAGPYVSTEIGNGVFLDASVFYGHSWNEISTSLFSGTFETQQVLVNAKLEGEWALGDNLTFRPNAAAFYLHETVDEYSVSNALGEAVILSGFTTDQVRLSVGGTLEYAMAYGDGLTLTPSIGANVGLASTDGSSFIDGAFGLLSTGFTLAGKGDWTIGAGVEFGLDASGLKTATGKAQLKVNF